MNTLIDLPLPNGSPSGIQVVFIIGFIVTWTGFAITLWKLRQEFRKSDNEQRDYIVEVATDAIVKWHAEPEQKSMRDRRITEISDRQIDTAFERRASSFVDSREFGRFETDLNRRLESIEKSQEIILREIGANSALLRANSLLRSAEAK